MKPSSRALGADEPSNGASVIDAAAVFAALDKIVADTPLEAPETTIAAVPTLVPKAMPDVAKPTTASPSPANSERDSPLPSSDLEATAPAAAALSVQVAAPPADIAAVNLDEDVEPASADVSRADQPASTRPSLVLAAMIGVSIIALVQAFFLFRGIGIGSSTQAAVPTVGTVSVQSTPIGAAVSVNGQVRGVTPLTLTLVPGDYAIEVKNGGVGRTLPLAVTAGSSSSQHVVFSDSSVASGLGGIQITSQPAGVRVTIDGAGAGVTPLMVSKVSPGVHAVVLAGPSGASRHSVTVQAGTISLLAVTMPAAGVSGGWVQVAAPFDVELYENGALIGTSQTERIMLAAGRHVIEAVNASLGYRASQAVQVLPGGVATIRLEVPEVNVNINAIPWADVTVGGRSLGTTPLGNVLIPVGAHQIVFRHPQLGERRLTTTVTLKGSNRVSVNMNER